MKVCRIFVVNQEIADWLSGWVLLCATNRSSYVCVQEIMIGRFVVLVALTLSVSRPLKAEFVIRPLVVDSTSPAWLPEGWTLKAPITQACINNAGVAALRVANAANPTKENALVAGAFDDLKIVAKTGDSAPGIPDAYFNLIGAPRLNDRGDILFYASLQGPGIIARPDPLETEDSLWIYRDGLFQVVVQSGSSSAGTNRIHPNYEAYVLAPDGQCAMILDHSDSQAYVTGLWQWRDGVLTRRYQIGEQLPGGTTFSSFFTRYPSQPVLAGRGMAVFGKNDGDEDCLWWLGAESQHSLVVQGATIDLGASGQAIFDGYSNHGSGAFYCANRNGDIVFHCWTSLGSALIKFKDNQTKIIALCNEIAPGTDGARFGSDYNNAIVPCINQLGQIGFVCELTGPNVNTNNNQGIWLTRDGRLELVARTGDQAPGQPAGVHFSRFNGYPFLNSLGQMLFSAELIGPGIGASNNEGIWFADSAGALEAVINEGAALDVGDGETRTVENFGDLLFVPYFFYEPNGDDGKGSPFNDRGELLFYAAWSQPDPGGGYFVASQFRVQEISINGGNLEISVPSRSGDSYRVLTKENVSAANWNPQTGTYSGQPWNTMITLPKPPHDSFFQILKEP